MNQQSNCTQLQRLISDIKLANNGYLLLGYMRPADASFARQAAQDGHVTITNGTVHMPKFKPEFVETPYPTKAFALRPDGPDYEVAILQRQEQAGSHD